MDWMYSDIVKDHFQNPRNIMENENESDFDGTGTVGNIRCGDQMMIGIKVEAGKIKDCQWKTYGCASAIASTSMLSEAVKGLSLDEAYHVKPEDIAERLGGLPENKIHCSVLGDKALRAAIEDYYTRQGQQDKIEKEEARIVCQCMNVTDQDIKKAVMDGAKSYEDLQNRTKIGTVCGQCKAETLELLEEYDHLYGSD